MSCRWYDIDTPEISCQIPPLSKPRASWMMQENFIFFQIQHPSLTLTLKEILSHLRTAHFDAAAMDLLYGECSLALGRYSVLS